ncbi:S8 family peptidase [Actinomadura decatromicini]|uniref:S8 family serine peptidase n=1 Tax=Actinomadura decatromicini TaxID=2604572 RepID=A0A5D3FM69_9ACTN|nr:S8 family serine peptidase [Actinomadura decatromicini]TYK49108.1 S8 family serine peptidase [Actinomadura decatromicini]
MPSPRRRVRAAAAVGAVALAGTWLAPVPARADEVRDRQRPVLNLLGMNAAWKVTKGRNVTVAVVDSGVDARQADLTGTVITGPNMLAEIDAGTRPKRLHGTGMASLIAGHGHGPGGGAGMIGIAPEARVLAIRAIGEPEDKSYLSYRTSDKAEGAVARGIRYATDHGADVINLSLGKDEEVADERAAIGYAIGRGVVVVSAVGNDGDDKRSLDGDGFAPYSYPASFPGVIAVAATRPGHERAPFSNRNYSVVVSAPGDGLPVAAPGGEYFLSSGTSDSSAIVSGIAALIRAKHPKMAPALVAQSLIQSVKNAPSGRYDANVGFGEVHAARALAAADSLASAQGGGTPGKPEGRRFGAADPGPVEIIERPGWVRPLIFGLLLGGVGGTVAAGAIALAFRRRHPRPADDPPFAGPGAAPFPARPGAQPPYPHRFGPPGPPGPPPPLGRQGPPPLGSS